MYGLRMLSRIIFPPIIVCYLCLVSGESRNTYMVREHYVIVFSAYYISIFYMGLYVSGGSHIKCTYMIG